MAIGTKFGDIHTSSDLNLIQQKVEIIPAKPRVRLVEVPGRNGSIDLSEAVDGMTYGDSTIKWTFSIPVEADAAQAREAAVRALHGVKCKIVLDDEPGWFYTGRVSVTGYPVAGRLHQIKAEAVCHPYKQKNKSIHVLFSEGQTVVEYPAVEFGDESCIPVISVTGNQSAIVTIGDTTATIYQGERKFPKRVRGTQIVKIIREDVKPSLKVSISWTKGVLV